MATEVNSSTSPAARGAQASFDADMLDSDFLKRLSEQLFDSSDQPTWPQDPNADALAQDVIDYRAGAEMPVALWAMFRSVVNQEPLPSAPLETALGRVVAAATAAQWPGPGSAVPDSWNDNAGQYRLFEIAWAVNLMMQAYARTGGGGGPREWPSGPPVSP